MQLEEFLNKLSDFENFPRTDVDLVFRFGDQAFKASGAMGLFLDKESNAEVTVKLEVM